jgi:multiple sugar transport system ATP-binding protein
MAEIRFEKVEKKFDGHPVIRGLDLTIHDGEFFTFVGPSGCGKSTILAMIAGLESVTAGRILFDGKVVNNLSPRDRDVALVFQSYALYPHMTVYRNIAFPLKMKKTDKQTIDSEVRRVASLLGLERLLNRKPQELSGGQRQRVALGRAIIRRPRLFLMDEPLSNLDAQLRMEMRAELRKLHQELKITTVYVTHDQAEALGLSDRMSVLNEGKLQQCGTPAEVYVEPANIFVGGFIGSPPMNFVPAFVKSLEPFEIDCNGVIITPATFQQTIKGNLIIGIRPEDVTLSRRQAAGGNEVHVLLVEPAGPFNWVDFTWKNTRMKGAAGFDEHLLPGDTAFMTFQRGRAVVFDELSGERL